MEVIMSRIDDASRTLERLRLWLLLVAPHWISGGTALVAAVSACCSVFGPVAESFTVELTAASSRISAEAAPAGARVPAPVRRCAR